MIHWKKPQLALLDLREKTHAVTEDTGERFSERERKRLGGGDFGSKIRESH